MLGKGNPHDHFTSRAVETDVTQQAGYLVWQLRSDSTGPDVALDDKDHNWVVVGGESAAHLWISLSLSIFGTKIPKSSIFPEILFFIFFNSSHPVCVVHESPKASRTFPAMWARCICPSFCGGGCYMMTLKNIHGSTAISTTHKTQPRWPFLWCPSVKSWRLRLRMFPLGFLL